MSCVLPGVPDVFARVLTLVSILMSEDFPTLLLPIKAYSGKVGAGHFSTLVLLNKNLASVMFMVGVKVIRCSVPRNNSSQFKLAAEHSFLFEN
jgi:hypothetical protein